MKAVKDDAAVEAVSVFAIVASLVQPPHLVREDAGSVPRPGSFPARNGNR